MMAGWKLADKDGDGFVSREEFASMPRLSMLEEEKRTALFTRLDKDADGKLSKEEIGRMMRPQDGKQGPPMPRLAELDTDKSGGVTLEEMRAGEFFAKLPAERQEAFFRRLDTDGDGAITPKDAPPRGPEGRRPGDRRGPESDRRVGERPGAEPGPRDLRGMIKALDSNGDGKLNFEEFQKAPFHARLGEDEQEDRFEALDTNHDLVLDEADLPAKPPVGGGRPAGPPPGP
jgi:Ca2+-binding EF-hand superfamily protein